MRLGKWRGRNGAASTTELFRANVVNALTKYDECDSDGGQEHKLDGDRMVSVPLPKNGLHTRLR